MEDAPAYVVDWELDQAESGLASFSAFLGAAGAKFTTLRKAKASPRFSPREMFEHRLMTLANKSLAVDGTSERRRYWPYSPAHSRRTFSPPYNPATIQRSGSDPPCGRPPHRRGSA